MFCMNLTPGSLLSTKHLYLPWKQLVNYVSQLLSQWTFVPNIYIRLTTLLSLKEIVSALYEYVKEPACHLVSPLIVPLDELRAILFHLKQDM